MLQKHSVQNLTSNCSLSQNYIILTLVLSHSNPCTDKNHLVLAPGVLKSGGINRACVSRFHPDGSARLLLTLLTEDLLTTTASRELPPGKFSTTYVKLYIYG